VWLGYTECVNGKPRSWVSDKIWGTPLEQVIKLHEAKHAEQLRRHPDCAAGDKDYAEHTAEREAEAMAAPFGKAPSYTLEFAAHWLSGSYPEFKLSFEEALALIKRYAPMSAVPTYRGWQ
jgi:hypothetical protein